MNILFIFLQNIVQNPDTVEAVDNAIDTEVTLSELILKGGWAMIPIILLSIIAVYIFIERFLNIRKASKDPSVFMEQVKSNVLKGDIEGAIVECEKHDSPVARMIEKGLYRVGHSLKDIEASIENIGKIELYKLEKNLSTLATIAGAAPMIGFLGTVLGMIKAFIVIAKEKTPDASHLAGGIYEAMVTTAAGLLVGIIAYIAYNYLAGVIQKVIHQMESTSIDFIDLLQEPQE